METAIDIVNISDFSDSIKRSGNEFLKRIFTTNELKDSNTQTLAGIFCVKECAIKADLINVGEWLKIEVEHLENGKPVLKKTDGSIISDVKISIAHTKEICVAHLIKL
jgi:holo-[acyl-carrier-protein] synthase